MLERIADAAGVDATVEIREDADGLHAEYVGDDLGLLIGHHGQTIDAIQHLAYRIAARGERVADAGRGRRRRLPRTPGGVACAPRPTRLRRPRSATGAPCRWRR